MHIVDRALAKKHEKGCRDKPGNDTKGEMKLAAYNRYCGSLPRVFHVVQWGDAHVWKVGGENGKVFAIAGWSDGDYVFVTFKCSPTSFDLLKRRPGLRPAPYLASRGMFWIQRTGPQSKDDKALRDYLKESHRLAALNLPKKVQAALGLSPHD